LEDLTKTPNVEAVYDDADEWKERWTRQSAILHIELRRWADMLVIAPLSANTLAKIVNGIADGLLLSVVRAWDTDGKVDGPGKIGRKRIVVAPAMNTAMWRQPVTARQMKVLEQDWGIAQGTAEEDQQGWFEVLSPIGKPLACGDIGLGGMAEWIGIVKVIEERLRLGGAGA
jgi:phosphopantothenoylcysteine decarboxylase